MRLAIYNSRSTALFLICVAMALLHVATCGELSKEEVDSYVHCANKVEKIFESTQFTQFNVIQLPPGLPGLTVVDTDLQVIQMHELSAEQIFSITAQISLQWIDTRLQVNDSLCYNSSAQFSALTTRALVWYPQFTISNGHGMVLLKEAWQFNPAIVHANGQVIWKFAANFFLECPLNVQLFPFDIQECSIDLTSPHYDVRTLKYNADSDAITAESDASLQSPLWRIIGQRTASVTDQYPSVSYRFLIQRRPGYYSVSVVLPNVVVNVMMSYTFLLPAIQEEKTSTAGAAVTCYFFIQLLFYSLSPMSSDNIPGLIIFFSFHTILALIAYVVECRLIRFAEALEEKEKDKSEKQDKKHHGTEMLSKKLTTKAKKADAALDLDDEDDRQTGPFDGISADYLNDWCLIGHVVAVLISYLVVFVYLPVKANALKSSMIPSLYKSISVGG